jgi:hypothetical protein
MLKNYNHDLVQQLSEISDSVWRIKIYRRAANSCPHCIKLWKRLEADYEDHIRALASEIGRHVKDGRFV